MWEKASDNMVESSKILTVSYGTFSCTLEGFEDSFSTMKAIAEYFRDLAAGDRYFGAEPPTPDTEMLTRIAEREISRRVEARTDDSGIVLRAAAIEDTRTPEPEKAAPQAPPEPTEAAEPQAPTMPPAIEDPAPDDTSSTDSADEDDDGTLASDTASFDDMAPVTRLTEAPAHPDSDSVAAKLQRIRAVVGKGYDTDDQAEDLTEPFLTEDTTPDTWDKEAVTEDTPEAKATDDTSPETQEVATPVAPNDEAPAVTDNEAPVVTDDEIAAARTDALAISSADVMDDALEPRAEAEAEEVVTEPQPVRKPLVRSRILRLGKRQRMPAPVSQNQPGSALVDDKTVDDDKTWDAENDVIADRLAARLSNVPTFEPNEDTEDLSDEDTATEGLIDRDTLAGILGDDSEITDAEDDDQPVVDAPATDDVIAEDDAGDDVVVEADAATIEGLDNTRSVLDDTDDGSLSVDDEAALREELAEVERDAASSAAERQGRKLLPETDDAAMDRISAAADAQLSEPEGKSRRNAIAQLKAAVAATEAARQLGDKGADPEATRQAFRNDLEDAVRPDAPAPSPPPAPAVAPAPAPAPAQTTAPTAAEVRPSRPTRPERPETRTERPRPAPLKLVASQRIDRPSGEQAEPVQPRRVATAEVSSTEVANFAEFAAEMGATELPDLLEAAAAYTAYVEGIEDFSRPQIMKKVQATVEQEFSREDGLRSFGTLLRQGRISKVRNGRFQVSEATRFKPEQKAG